MPFDAPLGIVLAKTGKLSGMAYDPSGAPRVEASAQSRTATIGPASTGHYKTAMFGQRKLSQLKIFSSDRYLRLRTLLRRGLLFRRQLG